MGDLQRIAERVAEIAKKTAAAVSPVSVGTVLSVNPDGSVNVDDGQGGCARVSNLGNQVVRCGQTVILGLEPQIGTTTNLCQVQFVIDPSSKPCPTAICTDTGLGGEEDVCPLLSVSTHLNGYIQTGRTDWTRRGIYVPPGDDTLPQETFAGFENGQLKLVTRRSPDTYEIRRLYYVWDTEGLIPAGKALKHLEFRIGSNGYFGPAGTVHVIPTTATEQPVQKSSIDDVTLASLGSSPYLLLGEEFRIVLSPAAFAYWNNDGLTAFALVTGNDLNGIAPPLPILPATFYENSQYLDAYAGQPLPFPIASLYYRYE